MAKKRNRKSAGQTRASEAELQQKIVKLMEFINTEGIACGGYRSLDKDPTIVTACKKYAGLVGLVSWHIMENLEGGGDRRIKNELSRKIDITPNEFMTRQHFYEAIAMNLLLYGDGNCVVRPHTEGGYLRDLEVIPANRVQFQGDPTGYGYKIFIDGIEYDPQDLLHFALTPDKNQLWKGTGFRVAIKDVADNLKQAAATEKAFNNSKWKPPMIVKVDGLTKEFADKGGRSKMVEDYISTAEEGQPWIIPAQQMEVQSVKPLTLQDLAIADTVTLNKKTVATIVGVPPFFVGMGEFKKDEFNNFVTNDLRKVVECIAQTMTKGLIMSPNWYIKGNIWQLLDWDLSTITQVFTAFGDRGWITGNEARDKINMEPKEGLDELKVLENYIPADMTGNQKKLIQEE
jgi:HK97 family phage portal protein